MEALQWVGTADTAPRQSPSHRTVTGQDRPFDIDGWIVDNAAVDDVEIEKMDKSRAFLLPFGIDFGLKTESQVSNPTCRKHYLALAIPWKTGASSGLSKASSNCCFRSRVSVSICPIRSSRGQSTIA